MPESGLSLTYLKLINTSSISNIQQGNLLMAVWCDDMHSELLFKQFTEQNTSMVPCETAENWDLRQQSSQFTSGENTSWSGKAAVS